MSNGNELAFPLANQFDSDGYLAREMELGLTKREYFAGLAMQGTLATYQLVIPVRSDIARIAVQFADALLAELEKAPAKDKGRE